MPLAAYALVTLADARTRLGLDAADDRLVQLEQLVNEVSRAIMETTGREYAPPTAAGVARIVGARRGSHLVDLYPYEARAVTAVTLAAGTTYAQTLTVGTDWQLGPITAPNGVYQWLELISPVPAAGSFSMVPITVTGTWGWSSVPEDVRGWALEMIEDRWESDFAAYADANANLNVSSSGPVTIPFRIVADMNDARRVRLGSV